MGGRRIPRLPRPHLCTLSEPNHDKCLASARDTLGFRILGRIYSLPPPGPGLLSRTWTRDRLRSTGPAARPTDRDLLWSLRPTPALPSGVSRRPDNYPSQRVLVPCVQHTDLSVEVTPLKQVSRHPGPFVVPVRVAQKSQF